MADVSFWDGMFRDLTGRGMFGGKVQIRLGLQPLLGFLLGMRFGIRDARRGRLPFFMSLFHGEGRGWPNLKKGLRDAIVPLCVAFLVDAILQHMILGYVRPMAAVLVGIGLVFVPFVIGRALMNRLWRRDMIARSRQAH